jgi:DNA-binding NtrC family response regulator
MKARHILLIDDDPLLLRALKQELKREPYTLHTAHSAAEAVQVLYEIAIDVVLTDHHMPDRTGLEFLCELKSSFPNVVRGLITGQPDVSIYMKAVNEGQVHFILTKPWRTEDLLGTIRLAVARKDAEDEVHGRNKSAETLVQLQVEHPGIMNIRRTESGAIHLEDD